MYRAGTPAAQFGGDRRHPGGRGNAVQLRGPHRAGAGGTGIL